MSDFYLLANKFLNIAGLLGFVGCVLFRKTKWIFFFVPAAFTFASLFQLERLSLGFGAHWFSYIFLFFIIFVVPKHRYLYLDRKIIIALFSFLSFAILFSMIVSIDRGRSVGRAMTFLLVFTIGIYSIPSISNIRKQSGNNEQNICYFITGIIFWCTISSVLFALVYGPGSLQSELGSAYFIIDGRRIDRLQDLSVGVNATGLGNAVGILVLYSIIGYLMNKSRQRRILYVCMLLCSLVVLFLSQSRSALIAVTGSFLLWSILEGLKTNNRGKILVILTVISILGIYFHYYLWQFFGRGSDVYSSIYDIFYQARLRHWIALIENAGDSLFYGFGLGNDRGFWHYLKGDNSYLIMMVQVGIIGLFFYLILLFFAIYNSYCWDKKSILHKKQFLPIFPFMIYTIIGGTFGDNLGVPTVTMSYFFALGILTKIPGVEYVKHFRTIRVGNEKK